MKYLLSLISVIFYFTQISFSQGPSFIENKNQWPEQVKYKVEMNAGAMFIEKDGFTYNFAKETDIKHSHAHHHSDDEENYEKGTVHYHAFKVKFINASEKTELSAFNPYEDYINYFIGNDNSRWASHVKRYRTVKYSELYPGIDLNLYGSNERLKYDLVIQKGADPSVIKIKYSGVENLKLIDGNLLITTTVNEITELHPVAFQIIDGEKKNVDCNFKLKNDIVTYEFPNGYNKDFELVIDPDLVFSTYTGSTVDNWGFTATFDSDGNVFSGGIVVNTGYPVSVGAYQVTHAGVWDVGIIKYTPNGTSRIFATYLGGSGCEIPQSLVVNEFNELLIFGTTGSADLPTTIAAFDQSFAGGTSVTYDNTVTFYNGTDIYVSKLSLDGSALLASTFVGGTGNDGLNFKPYIDNNYQYLMHGNDSLYYNYADGARGEIITDGKNNVYVGSCTFSTNFPVTSNTIQPTSGGRQDAVVFKLDYNLTNMIWSTYLGGTMDDAIYSIDTDSEYDVFVAGGSNSSNFPTTSGSYHPAYYGGTADGFIAHISQNGNQLVASTFFGSSTYDQVYFVRTDRHDNVFITGQTRAAGSTLVHNAVYSVPNSGQFIAKFNNQLNEIIWSTVFGTGSGKPNISITAFTVDVCSRVYVSGWGREWSGSPPYNVGTGWADYWASISGTKNLPVTSDAYQSTTDGQDFYIMVMSDDASSLDYATFFGEQYYSSCSYSGHDHVDGGTSRFDKKGNIYQSICASCGGCNGFPTFPDPGVWSPNNGAAPYNNCNNAVFRFSFMDDFSLADFDLPPVGCAPYNVQFENNSLGTNFYWDFGDGYTSTEENPSHTYAGSGLYNVMLIASDPGTCNLADTAYHQLQVLANEKDTLDPVHICPGDQPQIGVSPNGDPAISYHWYPSTGLSDITVANPYASPAQSTTYQLLVSNGNCIDTLYQHVEIEQNNFNVSLQPDTNICKGQSVHFTAVSNNNAIHWVWATDPAFSNIIQNSVTDSTLSYTPQSTATFYVSVTSEFCNFNDVANVTVNVREANIIAQPDTIICSGQSAYLTVLSQVSSDNVNYSWTPTSSIVSGSDTDNPNVAPSNLTNYIVVGTNQYGCTDVDTVSVDLDIVSLSISKTDVKCFGLCDGTISVSATGIPSYSYEWNNGLVGASQNGLCQGVYNVTVTDGLGCSKSSTAIITQPPLLAIALQDSLSIPCDGTCNGNATVNVAGGTNPYAFEWSNLQMTQTATGLCVGNYSVTVTDTNGCDTTDNIVVLDLSNLEANTTINDEIKCFGNCNGAITVNAFNGVPPYNYNWNNGTSGTNHIENLCKGFYYVTVSDAQNCLRIRYIYLDQPNDINSLFTGGMVVCKGDSADVSAQVSGGTGPYQYIWDDPLHQTTSIASGLYAGDYNVTITDANGCKKTFQVTLLEPEQLVMVSSTEDVICEGVCNGSVMLTVSGGESPYDYLWNTNSTVEDYTDLCVGDYSVTITDNRGCRILHSFSIGSQDYIPPLHASAQDSMLFIGQSTQLLATLNNDYTYTWSPQDYMDNPLIPNPEITPLATITYGVTVVDKNGCTNKDTVTVIVNDFVCEDPYVYVPNAFTPNADGNNDILFVYSNVASSVYFAIYDRWGEQVFVTNNLEMGWDGTFKGKELDPAVYVYYLEVTCLDQSTYVKKGNITLIR